MNEPQTIRLQKHLAQLGVGSRRHCEDLIARGRVAVNGTPVSAQGIRIDPAKDTVAVNGVTLRPVREDTCTILLNKPAGFICSTAERQGRTIYELLRDLPQRLVPVGRLDKETEGLLLLSNDGELVNRLTHPRFGQSKTYEVIIQGAVHEQDLDLLRSRLVIDSYRIQPVQVRILETPDRSRPANPADAQFPPASGTALEFILTEGRNRQIRKMCELAGLRIRRLTRIRIGTLSLGNLKPGEWRRLSEEDLQRLHNDLRPVAAPPGTPA